MEDKMEEQQISELRKLLGGNFDDFLTDGRGNGLAVFVEAGEIALDGVADIAQRFRARPAL